MRNQFPEIPTPVPTVYAQVLYINSSAKEGSLCYHNFNNHWTVSQLSQASCKQSIVPKLQKQHITVYAHTSDGATLQIIQQQVQVQGGSKDRRCFAVVFVVSLILGIT